MRMPHDFGAEEPVVEHQEGDDSAHGRNVENFHRRRMAGQPQRSNHIGLWVLGVLLLAAAVYGTSTADKNELPDAEREVIRRRPPFGWPW